MVSEPWETHSPTLKARFLHLNFGSSRDGTPDLLTSRPTCYHLATALCIYNNITNNNVNEHFCDQTGPHKYVLYNDIMAKCKIHTTQVHTSGARCSVSKISAK